MRFEPESQYKGLRRVLQDLQCHLPPKFKAPKVFNIQLKVDLSTGFLPSCHLHANLAATVHISPLAFAYLRVMPQRRKTKELQVRYPYTIKMTIGHELL